MSARDASMGVTFTTVHTHHTRFHPTIKTQSLTHRHLPHERRYLIKLPAAGSDKYLKEDKGPEAGDRYKKAKYGGDSDDDAPPEEESAGGKSKKKVGVAAVIANARSDEEVPPNFDLLVTFALGLLRALLRKISGEKGVGGGGGGAALGERREAILEGVVPLAVRRVVVEALVHPAARGALPRAAVHHETRRVRLVDGSVGSSYHGSFARMQFAQRATLAGLPQAPQQPVEAP